MSRAILPLWQYALALLSLFLALGLTSLQRGTAWFQGHINYRGVPFFKSYAADMLLDILVAVAVDRHSPTYEARPQGLFPVFG